MKYLLIVAFLNNGAVTLRDTGKLYDTQPECQLMGEMYKEINYSVVFRCYAIDN